jgi:hypothetical protein
MSLFEKPQPPTPITPMDDAGDTPSIAAPADVAGDATPEVVLPRRRGLMAAAVEPKALVLARQPETLDEAVAMIAEAKHLSPAALRHIRSDVAKATRVIKATVTPTPAALPCRPTELRPMLRLVLPARHGLKTTRWSSIKSSVIRVLKLTSWLATDNELYAPMSSEWQATAERVAEPSQRAVVTAFARYCTRQSIAPTQVTEATLETYRAWRTERTLDLTVGITLSQLRCIVNRMGRRVEDWPIGVLAAPPDPRRYALPREQFEPGFLADLENYLTRLRNTSPLDPVFRRRLAPQTIRDVDGTLRRAASLLIARGIAVNSLHDVLIPDHVEIVLLEGFHRLGDGTSWPTRMVTVVYNLRRAARQWGSLSPDQLVRIEEMRKLVGNSKNGLSSKSRDRIAQFDEDPALLKAFFELPGDTFAAADQMFHDGQTVLAARLHRTALSLALLQAKPMRRENLANLEHERHFVRREGDRYGAIRIPGTETKSGVEVKADFSQPLARRIALHMERYRPLLEAPDCRFLFAGPHGKALDPRSVAQHATRLVQRQVGIRFNVHAARHLAATMLLDADPANLPVAQGLLGHADAKTTGRYYAVQTTRSAQRIWMNVLDQAVTAARPARGGQKKKPNGPKGGR